MKRGGYGKSRRADRADYVPVPKPVAATEARNYVATSTETMIEEPSHQIKTADINASVAYIQSKGRISRDKSWFQKETVSITCISTKT